jgi:hypothetical protein
MTADLTSRGFSVNLYEMPEFAHNVQKLFETKTIEASGDPVDHQAIGRTSPKQNEARSNPLHFHIPAIGLNMVRNLSRPEVSLIKSSQLDER